MKLWDFQDTPGTSDGADSSCASMVAYNLIVSTDQVAINIIGLDNVLLTRP